MYFTVFHIEKNNRDWKYVIKSGIVAFHPHENDNNLQHKRLCLLISLALKLEFFTAPRDIRPSACIRNITAKNEVPMFGSNRGCAVHSPLWSPVWAEVVHARNITLLRQSQWVLTIGVIRRSRTISFKVASFPAGPPLPPNRFECDMPPGGGRGGIWGDFHKEKNGSVHRIIWYKLQLQTSTRSWEKGLNR